MLELGNALILGKGTERTCYMHPEDDALCIKINHSTLNKQSRKEIKYCELLNKQGKFPCQGIPQYYGSVTTNLGQDTVFERIRNYNGDKVKSLAETLTMLIEKNDTATLTRIMNGLNELKQDLLKQHILVRGLNLNNIHVQHLDQENSKLVLVDCFGNADFIPLANFSNSYARLKIQRKWKRLEAKISRSYPKNKTIIAILKTFELPCLQIGMKESQIKITKDQAGLTCFVEIYKERHNAAMQDAES